MIVKWDQGFRFKNDCVKFILIPLNRNTCNIMIYDFCERKKLFFFKKYIVYHIFDRIKLMFLF